MMENKTLNVGIVGAGIGGVMAAIAIAQAGGTVTVLEAAAQLGEIGAGIQMVCMIDMPRHTTDLKPDPQRSKVAHSLRCRQSYWEESSAIP